MPYISKHRRGEVEPYLDVTPLTAGELNFVFTVIAQRYFRENGGNYQAINDIVGALEGAKLEFYRRVAAPYEDKKIAENGDVLDIG